MVHRHCLLLWCALLPVHTAKGLYADCGDDVQCTCQQACAETCNGFNITTTTQGLACGACMQDQCHAEVKDDCHGDLSCLACLADKALCFANPVNIARALAKCAPSSVLFNPLACLEAWINGYALQCVKGLFQCVPERPHPVVFTESGNVRGLTRSYGKRQPRPDAAQARVDLFWGIPFAAPPTGENRFRPPQPFTSHWAPATRDASSLPLERVCPQVGLGGSLQGQEDCLYLNVARPSGADSGSNLPVFVWIFGGGYFVGDSYEGGAFDAGRLVGAHGYVVVSMNYRLSGLGFYALPELLEESRTTGNYGVQDQRAALQWVRRNIRYFGGNPDRVTIAGESAGAFSTMWQLVSPQSRGLFHGAIMESGTTKVDWFFQNRTDAYKFYDDSSAILGCNVARGAQRLACLRALPHHVFVISLAQMVKDIAAKMLHLPIPRDIPDFASPLWPLMPFGPVIDGSDEGLPDVPLTLVQQGKFNRVPLILGSNKDEGTYFGPIFQLLWGGTAPDVRKMAEWILPREEDRARMVSLYGGADFPSDTRRSDQVIRDVMFECADRALATAWDRAGLPAYLYSFAFDFGDNAIGRSMGDAHGFELPFVWKNFDKVLGRLAGDAEGYSAMSDIMSCTWASFVACGAPKCDSAPPNCKTVLSSLADWPQFSESARSYYSLRLRPVVKAILPTSVFNLTDEFPGDDRCDFWDLADLEWHDIRDRLNKKWFKQLPAITTFV